MSLIPIIQGGHSTASGFDTTLIPNSAWFDGSADYLNRTPGSAGNRTRWLLSWWFQLNAIATDMTFFSANSGSNDFYIRMDGTSSQQITVHDDSASGSMKTVAMQRDVSWYHCIVSLDTNESSATDRLKIYINGEQQELTTHGSAGTFNSSGSTYWNNNQNHEIGRRSRTTSSYANAYMAQILFLDGDSIQNSDVAVNDILDIATFGTNGSQRIPKANATIAALATSAGGNSFCLDFADASNFGNDISGNSPSGENDFSVQGGMGSANHSIHTPTKVYPKVSNIGIPSGDTAANYTMGKGSNRMVYSGSNQTYKGLISTQIIQPDDPAIYWEFYLESGSVSGDGGRVSVGLAAPDFNVGNGSGFVGAAGNNPSISRTTINDNGSVGSVASKVLAGGVQNLAYEPSTGKIWFGVDGTWNNGSATASTTLNTASHDHQTTPQDFVFFIAAARSTDIGVLNFGDNPTFSGNETAGGNSDANGHGNFKYAVPSGFLAPVSANLTAPTHQGCDHFAATKYTGNGTAIGSGGLTVSNGAFSPALVWIKNRDADDDHAWYDTQRGVTKQIESNTQTIESTESEGLTSFTSPSTGFTVGNLDQVNTNTEDYIAWQWKAGTAFSGNGSGGAQGTVASSGVVAAPDHFSIFKFTGNSGTAYTAKHGLSAAPEFFVVKHSGTSGSAWVVYAEYAVSDAETDYLLFDTASGLVDDVTVWNDTAPNENVISIGTNSTINNATAAMIGYAWRSVPGVCKVGSWTGNGASGDGPYINLGFQPRFFMFTNVASQNWVIWDSVRDTTNPVENTLFADDDGPVSTTSSHYAHDNLADGIKIRATSGHAISNASGAKYIYIAMANIAGNGTLPPIYGR